MYMNMFYFLHLLSLFFSSCCLMLVFGAVCPQWLPCVFPWHYHGWHVINSRETSIDQGDSSNSILPGIGHYTKKDWTIILHDIRIHIQRYMCISSIIASVLFMELLYCRGRDPDGGRLILWKLTCNNTSHCEERSEGLVLSKCWTFWTFHLSSTVGNNCVSCQCCRIVSLGFPVQWLLLSMGTEEANLLVSIVFEVIVKKQS